MASLKKFDANRRELAAVIHDLSRVATARESGTCVRALKQLKEKLDTDRFHLVVLGEFKRGKSTFLNALLGEELLPTGVIPVTAIITILKYGPSLRIKVFFQNKQEPQQIPLAELPAYVSQESNPNNAKKVKYVTIEYPSRYLADGVMLIDTPGVGSIYRHNTETAHDFLPQVDAAIFLIAVDPPVSQEELNFLQTVQEHVKKIFFVQNKKDYLSPEKLQESVTFSRKAIGQQLERPVTIYPISAKLALEAKIQGDREILAQSRLPEFEMVLEKFLLEEKGKTLLNSTLARVKNLLQDLQFSIELELKAAETPLHSLEEKIAKFEGQLGKVEKQREQNGFLLEGEVDRIITRLEERLDQFKEKLIGTLPEEIRQCWHKNTHLGNRELADTLDSFLKNSIVTLYTRFRQETEEWLRQELNNLFSHYAAMANTLIEDILQLCAGLFDLSLQGFSTIEPLSARSNFYFKLEDSPHFFTVDPTTISTLLPRKLAQQRILKSILTKVPHQVDRTSGRVRFDFVERIKESSRQFQKDLTEKFLDTREGIRTVLNRALTQRREKETQIDRFKDLIEKELGRLQEISQKLDQLKNEVERL